MQISIEELAGGVTRVVLDGRLDIASAQDIDQKVNVNEGCKKAVLVDKEEVSFIGSMGLWTLIAPAKAIKGRGGKMVLFGPKEIVKKALRSNALERLIPIHHEFQCAVAAL